MERHQRITIALGDEVSMLRRGAPLRNVEAVVLPELVDGGYRALASGRGTHQVGDEFWREMREASQRLATTIVAGSVRLASGRARPTNTSLVFARGRLLHRYDKIHLFRPTGDDRYFHPGRRLGSFRLAGRSGRTRRAAVVLCYDLRFPELIRALALKGTEILFVPARWPAARDLAWRTLLRARAIENQMFVVGCNAPDREGGRSYVYGPGGEELMGGTRVGTRGPVRVVLPMALLDRARRLHRALDEAVVLQATGFPRWLAP